MKNRLLFTAVALLASSGIAFAGSSRSTSTATAGAFSDSASRAVSLSQGGQGGNVTFNTPANTRSDQNVHYSGTQTIRSAPQVVAPGFSSGHPCAYAPVSIGISVIGFGGAIGGQKVDDACLLAQMGVGQASVLMIAQRNPAACQALLAVGRVRSCGGRQAAAAPVPTARPVKYVSAASLPKGTLYRKNGKLYRKQ